MTDTNLLKTHFSILPDPRIDRQKRHELLDITLVLNRFFECEVAKPSPLVEESSFEAIGSFPNKEGFLNGTHGQYFQSIAA